MTNRKPTNKKIIQVLNEGASDKEEIINSPALGEGKMSVEEVESETPNWPVVDASVKKIEFLRNRILQDAKEISSLVHLLELIANNVKEGAYYINEGIDSIKQGLEYLKDSEGGS